MIKQMLSWLDPRRGLANPRVYSKFQERVRGDESYRRLAEFLKLQPGDRVLDIGCGTADILAYLPDDIEYHGYDLSERYIEAARNRYGRRGAFRVEAVAPHAADNLGAFDVVISIGVLHHLADKEADVVFASAHKLLRSGGRLLTCDGAYVDGQHPIARLLLALDRGRHVRPAGGYVELAKGHFPNATATILHDLLALPYTQCVVTASR
jgi:SAM-dependent methyltransferase